MSVAIQSKREELAIAFPDVIIIQQLVSLGHDTVTEINLDKHTSHTVSIPSNIKYVYRIKAHETNSNHNLGSKPKKVALPLPKRGAKI